ncbi:MAG: VWA domain-containing protein [Acidobacteria bacterium]|nr:VWA domain-containing protein [Acidobacteriota bacterium]
MTELIDFTHPGYLLLLPAIPLFILPRYGKNKGNPRRRRTRSLLVLRITTAALIILALAGIRIAQGKRTAAVVYVVDRSDSIAPDETAGIPDILDQLGSSLKEDDESGVVVFGRDAVIEQPLRKNLKIREIQSTPASTGTRIETALGLARSMLSARPRVAKKIVLLSDGVQTSGDALREAALAAAEGIPVDVLPLGTITESGQRSVFIRSVSGPESVRLEEPFDLAVTLDGKAGSEAVLGLYHDNALISERRISMASENPAVFRLPVKADTAGFHRYRIGIQNPDRIEDADETGHVVYAHGRTRILHLTDNPSEFLDNILIRQGFEVQSVAPQSILLTTQSLAPFDAVIMDDVPDRAFSGGELRSIADHVGKYAGGLIMTGGARSFGPGGYIATAVEKVLPVEIALRSREKKPALSVILVLDKSGSMGIIQQNVSKLDMARDAVLRLSELLSPEDELGIIAFDRLPEEVVPLERGFNPISIEAAIDAIEAGGGTAILPALDMAYSRLQASRAERKHVLLLSDGQAEEQERKPLTQRVSESSIILSTVGIGGDVDRPLLEELARLANGRAYFTRTGSDLPDIFKREGLLISGKWLVEGSFHPRRVSDHEILRGLETDAWPEITGYVATASKDLSDVLLEVENRDPLMVCGRYGLGRALVFTSDLAAAWTDRFVAWKGFPGMWTQMVRWTSRNRQSELMHPQITIEDETALLTIDAHDLTGNFLNLMEMKAQITTPDETGSSIEMIQKAPGGYEGQFRLRGKGSYLFTVTAQDPKSGTEYTLHFGYDLSKFPEDRPASSDEAFLSKVAATGGGALIDRDTEIFPEDARMTAYVDVWPYTAILALLLFLLDAILRRL